MFFFCYKSALFARKFPFPNKLEHEQTKWKSIKWILISNSKI